MKNLSMTGDCSLLQEVLDQSPLAIYVNALDTWDLLYCNASARELLLGCFSEREGVKCYEMMGFDKPCPYCRVKQMSYDKNFSREFYHPRLKRTFRLNGKLIDWGGVPAHIEYISDISAQKKADDDNKASMDELKSVLKNVPGGLCVYRFDGKTISPVFHNEEFYRILGYSDEHIFQIQEKTENLNVYPDDVGELNRKIFEVIQSGGVMYHTYRVFNDKRNAYRWIRLDGIAKKQEDGSCLLYGLYTDVDDQRKLEDKLADESIRTQNIINAVPGGVAIYRVSDVLETIYFSDGLPALLGYSAQEYNALYRVHSDRSVYEEDRGEVVARIREAIATDSETDYECRERHSNGSLVWVQLHAQKVGEDNGIPLVQCVFHDITALKEAQQELDHVVNSIPGGIAVYRLEDGCFMTNYYTDGVAQLTGHTREEYDELIKLDLLDNLVFDKDRERVRRHVDSAVRDGYTIDVTYRRIHKDGHPVWVHLNAKMVGAESNKPVLYAVLTGMSAETKLYQNIANEAADGIYVIDRNNYDLLYANESVRLFMDKDVNPAGKKCYAALHGKSEPCSFCGFHKEYADGEWHQMQIPDNDRIYQTRYHETDWNGIPAYIKFVSDITEEDNIRRQKERMEEYFQAMIRILPGGVVVVRFDEKLGTTVPEFISDGFAAMCGMTQQEVWNLYSTDSFSGVHPDDIVGVKAIAARHMAESEDGSFELRYRIRKKDGSYFWIKNNTALVHNADGGRVPKFYSTYSDINNEMIEHERMRNLYNDMLLQHHSSKDPNLIMAGHCSLTQRRVIQMTDWTNNDPLAAFGTERDAFFTGFSTLIVDKAERQKFLDLYLTEPLYQAFQRGETKHELDCFIELPNEETGRYVHIIVNTLTAPDNGDVIGILSVLDCTEQQISERILHRLASTNYDFIGDVDLRLDRYKLISYDKNAAMVPNASGSYTKRAQHFLEKLVVPKDQAMCREKLDPDYIRQKLSERKSYTFHYIMADTNGKMYTKSMVVFYIDRRLERVCLARTDISDSVREQRQLLNILAYTFDLACFIDVEDNSFTMHTRETVLKHLLPYCYDNYEENLDKFADDYGPKETRKDMRKQFDLNFIQERLRENPQGYEFTFPYRDKDKTLQKQVNILWGDENHQTICMVRADVTKALNEERATKEHLKSALAIAQEANRAKTDFLSSMSHDIRTPMNAIMGMTDLAISERDNPAQIDESLSVIKNSSGHLLHLINDILDMSRIESGKMVLLKEPFQLTQEVKMVQARSAVLAENKRQQFSMTIDIRHNDVVGDAQRVQQILENLIGNAVKFTPEGGTVSLVVTELPQKNKMIGWYRFEVIDSGIGMDEDTQKRIFDPFFRAQNSQLNHVEGTGLGLSIVKNIVDYKGGVMSVESLPGKGSKFIVDLPLPFVQTNESNRAEPAPAPNNEDENLGDVCILVVEDHPINQLVAMRMLEEMGAKVVIAENGEEGLKAFEASAPNQIDAICMDIQMPVMDGYAATKAIRASAHPQAKSIPIVAMTANAFAADVKRCLDEGMNDHIAKPIESGNLFAVLRKHISRSEK